MLATRKCFAVVCLTVLLAVPAFGQYYEEPGEFSLTDHSPFLYGFHYYGTGAENLFKPYDRTGYCVEQCYISEGTPGINALYSRVAAAKNAGFTPIVRFDWQPNQTVPLKDQWTNRYYFAYWCGQAAYQLRDICDIYVIGNEMNHPGEGAIDPGWYLKCFNSYDGNNCYDKIHAKDPVAIVCMGAVAPWCPTVDVANGPYNHNWEQWKNYFWYLVQNVNNDKVDGFAIHAYGGRMSGNPCVGLYDNDPRDDNSVAFWNQVGYNEPTVDMTWGFNCLQYLMTEIGSRGTALAKKPVYVTEANTSTEVDAQGNLIPPSTTYRQWWMQCAYEAVDCWNKTHYQKIKALCWFVYSYGYGWENFAIMDRPNMPANLAQARADFAETVANTWYTTDNTTPYATVWNLHTYYTNPNSSNPNDIVVNTYAGRYDYWKGEDINWGTGGPNGLSDYWIFQQGRMFYVSSSGWYDFKTTSDDGSWLWIDGELVVNNYGLHGLRTVTASKYLVKGYHWVYVKFFEWTGGAYTAYAMRPSGGSWGTIGNSVPPKGNAIVYGLDVGGSNLGSTNMGDIKLGTFYGALGWSGYHKDWGTGGPNDPPYATDNFVIIKPFMFYVGEPGTYSFRTGSDDGSWLWIDGEVVVNNYGLHGLQWAYGSKHLMPGWHHGFFKMFEHTGGANACFQYKPMCSQHYDCFFAY